MLGRGEGGQGKRLCTKTEGWVGHKVPCSHAEKSAQSLTFQGLYGNNNSGLYRLIFSIIVIDKHNTLIASELIILMPWLLTVVERRVFLKWKRRWSEQIFIMFFFLSLAGRTLKDENNTLCYLPLLCFVPFGDAKWHMWILHRSACWVK